MVTPARPVNVLAFALALLLAAPAVADTGALRQSFAQPPDDARILVRWWWFGPAVTKPELEREMRMMKAGGMGGFEVQPVYPLARDGDLPGLRNLPFLSPEFLDMLGFSAAKAKELGLRMDLTLGSGWPYGGPMFSVAENAGELRSQNGVVPSGQPSALLPALREGEGLIAAFMGPAPGAEAVTDAYRDFYQRLDIHDQAAWLPAGIKGPAPIVFFIASHTGMKVKRAAAGAEGYVLDHYDADAVAKFLRTVAAPELAACGPNLPWSVFCDSLEVFNTDWTSGLLAEFKQRRGYDLVPYLPALMAEDGPKTAEIRHDWGRTLTEVFDDHFIAPIQAWAADHGTRFRIQAYGTPPAALFSYAAAALPEGEGDEWKTFRATRWASSASHLLGNPITSSETWTWLHPPVFRATPLDMKAAADRYFLQGSNQLIAHGWPYTAAGVSYPGWRFYASAVFDEKNPWWIVMPDVTSYLQRVSFILRQGNPVDDVALYLGDDDAWSRFTAGHVAMSAIVAQGLGPDIVRRILESGHNLDFFDDTLLAQRGRVSQGALAFGDLRYRAVVLAGVERMPVATLRQLEAFARQGGILIATRRLPAIAPGFTATEADQAEVHAIVQRLFTDPGAPGIFLPLEDQVGAALSRRLFPDVSFSSPAPDVGFVHRHVGEDEVYFLANTANTPVKTQATFRVESSSPLNRMTGEPLAVTQPQWWDPMTGKAEAAVPTGSTRGSVTVSLDLAPYASRILVFSPHGHLNPRGDEPASPPVTLDLSRGWTVAFGAGAPAPLDQLASWTENPATKNFSGVATYEKTVTVPAGMPGPLSARLDFGPAKAGVSASRGRARYQAVLDAPVREAAVVYINGRRAGSVWCPPYALDLTGFLQPGENHLRIEVANLAVNEMAAHPLPDYTALNARYGERFEPQEMNEIRAVPAGLLGPITLTLGLP
jgi:hypothetical protein